MRNRTGLVLCALVLLTGFLMICLGAFLISSGSMFNCRGNLILAYMLLPLGFVILLSGIFWSTYRQARESKGVFTHVLRRHLAHGALPLATVDRYVLKSQGTEGSCNGAEFWKSGMTLIPQWNDIHVPPGCMSRNGAFLLGNYLGLILRKHGAASGEIRQVEGTYIRETTSPPLKSYVSQLKRPNS